MKKRTLALAAAFALAAVATGCSGQEKEAETQAAASSQAGAGAEGETAGSADAKSDLEATRYENILSSGVLKIGTEGTYKPFTYHDENNELCGYDVEVGKMIGDKLGVKTEFSEITWEGLLTSLDTGTVDLVLNQVGVTPEREEKYDFSDPPFLWACFEFSGS